MNSTSVTRLARFNFLQSGATLAAILWTNLLSAQPSPPGSAAGPAADSRAAPESKGAKPEDVAPPAASSEATSAAPPAASAPAPEPVAAPVVPPKLIHEVTPSFPRGAREQGIEHASVVLRLTVTTDGQSSDVELVESAGQGFDEAAIAAVLSYRFEPARRGEEALAARILLRIEFSLPQEQAPIPPPVDVAPAAPVAVTTAGVPAVSPPPDATAPAAVEVTVVGYSDAEKLRRSAEAVHVIETTQAKQRTADLGEVLARTQGIGVQRSGGLGSETRVSLNGLTDDQIRFFVDGVPLEFMGFPFGMANVPVNLVDRVEIYRGVVPNRFGADALGGAVNLVTDQDIAEGTHGSTSVQAGSFGTYRLTLGGHHRDTNRGTFGRVSGFVDRADNNYPMDDVKVADATGNTKAMRVYRFHDAYRAQGASIEVGALEQPWARKLILRTFITRYTKEIQHNLLMTFNPYGDVELREESKGATLRYENVLGRSVFVKALAGYTHRKTDYEDLGTCVYSWLGQCIRPRAQPGERTGRAADQDYWEHNFFGRLNGDWRFTTDQALRLSLSPTFMSRSAQENRLANQGARDPLSAQRSLFGLVSGIEHELDALDDRLENVLFVKDYLQMLRSEDPLSAGQGFRRRDRTTHRFGVGDSLRYTFVEWLYAKASYERATRLPRPDEIFGNAFPVQPNLELKPETSHNVNLGLSLDGLESGLGKWRGDINAFMRDADGLIVLVGDKQTATYQNVYRARSLGTEVAAGWSSPHDYISLDGNVTYVDFRNTSNDGGFEDYKGDRIPNRPYLFATGNARLMGRDVAAPNDELSANWTTRYVHSFFRAWEGLGSDKLDVPAQLVHAVALTYAVSRGANDLSFTGEVQNLTNEKVFDIFRVPRPGRATYFKATLSL